MQILRGFGKVEKKWKNPRKTRKWMGFEFFVCVFVCCFHVSKMFPKNN